MSLRLGSCVPQSQEAADPGEAGSRVGAAERDGGTEGGFSFSMAKSC